MITELAVCFRLAVIVCFWAPPQISSFVTNFEYPSQCLMELLEVGVFLNPL